MFCEKRKSREISSIGHFFFFVRRAKNHRVSESVFLTTSEAFSIRVVRRQQPTGEKCKNVLTLPNKYFGIRDTIGSKRLINYQTFQMFDNSMIIKLSKKYQTFFEDYQTLLGDYQTFVLDYQTFWGRLSNFFRGLSNVLGDYQTFSKDCQTFSKDYQTFF